jgi:hypothetical protein
MRIREIISEANGGKISKREQQATAGLHTYDDGPKLGTFGSDYGQYRLMMALAGSDGKTPIDMDSLSWIAKKKTAHPYTEIESEMLKQGYKTIGLNHKDLNNGDMKSKELDSTNKSSPVAKPKPNKYGV